MPPSKKLVLETWKKSFLADDPADINEAFPIEMLFREGKDEYWIAVQKPLVQPIRKEVQKAQEVKVYMILMGAIEVDGHWDWLFAINEFETPPPQKHD